MYDDHPQLTCVELLPRIRTASIVRLVRLRLSASERRVMQTADATWKQQEKVAGAQWQGMVPGYRTTDIIIFNSR